MEFPIRVMMVLFVAMIVAVSIIQFSRSTIQDSKERMSEIGKDPDALEKQLIESSCSPLEVVYLAEECLRAAGELGPDKSVCFILKCSGAPNNAGITAAWTTEGNDAGDLDTTGMTAGQTTLYISYDPLGQVVLES